MADAYWVGQNGNLYFKGSQGVQDWGSARDYNLANGGIQASSQSTNPAARALGEGSGFINATQIQDPALSKTVVTAPANPTGTTTPAKVLNQGAVNNTQQTLDQLPALLQSALASESTSHQNNIASFDQQEKAQTGQYDGSTVTNQQNYDANFMDSIRAGVKGLGNLMNILRGTGAGGGSIEGDVQDVVGGVTSNDIRNGADTQKANQGQLDTALSTFLTELHGKRQANEDTFTNNNRAITRDNATQMQDLYGKLAGFYGDADQNAQRDTFMAKAGSFTPTIAANSASQVSRYDTTPVAVQAPQLTAFAAPSQPNAIAAPQDGQVGSGIFTINKRKDEMANTPVALAQGA